MVEKKEILSCAKLIFACCNDIAKTYADYVEQMNIASNADIYSYEHIKETTGQLRDKFTADTQYDTKQILTTLDKLRSFTTKESEVDMNSQAFVNACAILGTLKPSADVMSIMNVVEPFRANAAAMVVLSDCAPVALKDTVMSMAADSSRDLSYAISGMLSFEADAPSSIAMVVRCREIVNAHLRKCGIDYTDVQTEAYLNFREANLQRIVNGRKY